MKTLVAGMRIVEAPNIPLQAKMTCSPEFVRLQTPELVSKTNKWMLERFGSHYPMWHMPQEGVILVHPSMMYMFRNSEEI